MRDKLLPLACSFCHKEHKDVAKLIAGPSVYICNECVFSFVEGMKSGGSLTADKGAAEDRCSFCGKPRAEVAAVFSRDDHRICNECLDICLELSINPQFSDVTGITSDNPQFSDVTDTTSDNK